MNNLFTYQLLPQWRIFQQFVGLQIVTNLTVIKLYNAALYYK
jgi:hypothetical protein